MPKYDESIKGGIVKKILVMLLWVATIGFAVEFNPSSEAGKVSVTVDETSLKNLISVYENAGYYDFGVYQMSKKALPDKDWLKIKINALYFWNFQLNLTDGYLELDVNGNADVSSSFLYVLHPHLKTNASAHADMLFKDFAVSDENKIDLSVCLSNVDVDLSGSTFGYVKIIDDFLVDNMDAIAKNAVQAKIKEEANFYNCIDITKYVTINYPDFLAPIRIKHPRTKIKNNEISVYGCPTTKSIVDDVVVVGDTPCETVGYDIVVYTANDIPDAGTNSKITLNLCGDDIFGEHKCFEIQLKDGLAAGIVHHTTAIDDLLDYAEGYTGFSRDDVYYNSEFKYKDIFIGPKATLGGQAANLPTIETDAVLVKNLSIELKSDNTGKSSDWYVDSVTVNMKLPNDKTFHYWFPIHSWIGGTSSTSYTATDKDQLYIFTIATGDGARFDHAGTNSDIIAKACDINKKCVSFYLNKKGIDDFESGSVAAYPVVSREKLADIKSLTLYNVYKGEHAGWYVQDVIYKHYSLPENIDHTSHIDGQVFMFRQWLAEGEYKDSHHRDEDYAAFKTDNGVELSKRYYISVERKVDDNFGYDVTIKTKAGGSNGTDADIILTLEGCSGKKQVFNLNDDVNNFEKGRLDIFNVQGVDDLKGIKKISLKNDGSHDHPGWTPEYITIEPIIYNKLNKLYYNAPYNLEKKAFPQSLNSDDWDWDSEIFDCPDVQTPSFNADEYDVHPGESVVIYGVNLDKADLILMTLDKTIKPDLVTSQYAIFQIPEQTALGDYETDAVTIGGVVQPVIIHVLAEKPILDGIAITRAEPGEAFEVSIRNVAATAKFYLETHELKLLATSASGVYLQIPKNMENGIYRFRTVSNGWDITYDETIEIIKSVVPHISSISDNPVYTGQIVDIFGKNFGKDPRSITVMVGEKQAEIKSLENEKITIQIPTGIFGKDIVVSVVREDVPAPETLTIEIKGLPWFMSFDDVEHPWTCDNAELTYDETIKVGDAGYSLKIHGDGYKAIVSPKFNTYELGAVSNELQFDIWIPETQANPYWWGDAQMSVNIPAAGLYNAWVGQVLLTGLQPGWNTLTFNLSDDIYNALAGDYPNATLTIILNANQNSDDFRIDNLRFGGDVKIRTTEHVVASEILNNYSTDFMSFDNVNDWALSGQELLFVESPKTQGLGATGVVASGYNEIKSRSFTPSELKYVSSVVSLDIYVPNPQPNDYWVGSVGLGLNCPDRGINSMNLGSADLTHMFREEFNNVQFTLPNEALAALRYGVGECSFSIYLNVNNGAGTFLLDNMGFVQIFEVAGR